MKKRISRLLKRAGFHTGSGQVRLLRAPTDPLKKARRVLSPELTERVEWNHTDLGLKDLQTSRYYGFWKSLGGGLKKYSYFHLYDRIFSEYSGTQPKLLEIGVYKGASLRAWKEFLGEGSTVVGIDVDHQCSRFEDKSRDIHVRIGSQGDPQFLRQITDDLGPFDIIVDDGSHLTHHVIEAFNQLFLRSLNEGGVYFIEDLNTSYWRKYRTSRYSAMDLVLTLAEMTHQFYFEHGYDDYKHEGYKNGYQSPRIATLLEEVRVFDSAAAIYKRSHNPPLVFRT